MLSLADLMERAGLVPLSPSNVEVPNYKFPVVFKQADSFKEYEQPLMCSEETGSLPSATLLYFTLPECENCRPGLHSFQRLAQEAADQNRSSNTICFRVVVSDWPTRAEIDQELRNLSWKENVGVVWDSKGVLAERMAVLAQPAFFVLDSGGRVAAYHNGTVEFRAPGFEVFWKTFIDMLNDGAFLSAGGEGWVASIRQELPAKSNQTVTFLNNGALSVLWLVTAGAVCYSLIRFFLRLRKNFNGSSNSS